MTTGEAVVTAILEAIEAIPISFAGPKDGFQRYEGDPQDMPLVERLVFPELVSGPDRVTARMGAGEMRIELRLHIVYRLTAGTLGRVLADGRLLADAIAALQSTGIITEVDERGTTYAYPPGGAMVAERAFAVAYASI